MYLTRSADYTLRLLIHLAVQKERTSTIQEIAEHYGISKNHLMKVAHRAVQTGFVEGVRGRSGGLKLAKAPDRIGLGDVLRATREDFELVECFDARSNRCVITGGCGLRVVLHEALDAYFAVLDRYSLADIVTKRKLLVQLLGLKTA